MAKQQDSTKGRAPDTHSVEERLDRVKAILIAMQAMAVDDACPDLGVSCVVLEQMAEEEMEKVRTVLGAQVMNLAC